MLQCTLCCVFVVCFLVLYLLQFGCLTVQCYSDSQLWALTQYRVLQRYTLSVNESIECHSVSLIVLAEMINVELVTSGFRIMYMASPSVLGIFC